MVKYDKIVLIKPYGNLKTVGEIYEIANITDTFIVIREEKTKQAVCSIDIDMFKKYFSLNTSAWTTWNSLSKNGNTVAFYRTNGKKVQVKLTSGYKAEATCNSSDMFNIRIGINIAYMRCIIKENADTIKKLNKETVDAANRIKELINNVKPLNS